ncbi:MAG: hypothetical protein P1V36_08195, partial [Planctomycetota bacterium]|nr:hypothetical protein [Planctomycetota bacterium]
VLLVATVGLCLAPALEAADKPGATHKNESWGFRVRFPDKWTVVNMSTKEQWICAKFLGKRELYGPKGEGWGETPEMWVVGFPTARQRERGAKREKIGKGVTLITVENPYKNFKDFVKREKGLTTEGGYYYTREEETKIGDVPVSIYEIKVEKMVETPRTLLAYVYHFEDVDFAVMFKIVHHHYKDWSGTIKSCLGSLRQIERSKPMPGTATTGKKIIDEEDESTLTPQERKQRRKQKVEAFIKAEKDNLPKDWQYLENENFAVFSHTDKKYAKRVLAHATNVFKYLEKTFPGLGDDYVPRAIIRIFGSSEEERAFGEGTTSLWFSNDDQILVSKDQGGGMLWELAWLSKRVTSLWLRYKNRMLSENMSPFIRWGLEGHMENMRPSKRKGLQFARDAGDILSARSLINEGKAQPIRELFEKERESNEEGITFGFGQEDSVMSWLLTDGNKGKVKKSVCAYLNALDDAIRLEEAKWEEAEAKRIAEWKERVEKGEIDKDDDEKKPDPEDAWKEYSRSLEEKQAAIRKGAFEAAFGHLSDKDWVKLDKKWQKWAIGK